MVSSIEGNKDKLDVRITTKNKLKVWPQTIWNQRNGHAHFPNKISPKSKLASKHHAYVFSCMMRFCVVYHWYEIKCDSKFLVYFFGWSLTETSKPNLKACPLVGSFWSFGQLRSRNRIFTIFNHPPIKQRTNEKEGAIERWVDLLNGQM